MLSSYRRAPSGNHANHRDHSHHQLFPGHRLAEAQQGAACGCGSRCGQEPLQTLLSDVRARSSARLRIAAMDCPVEARLIEKALVGMPGVASLRFDFFERVLTVEHALPSLKAVLAAIERVGMTAYLIDSLDVPAPSFRTPPQWPMIVSGVAALGAEALSWITHDQAAAGGMALALISILSGGGLTTLRKGWIALKSRTLNIHFLMSLAVGGAVLLGQWPEAAMVLFLFGVAEKLEGLSLARAGEAVRELMALAPATAWVAQAPGVWSEVPADSVLAGARVRVRPGERVPVDGEIVSGHSAFDEAALTGESLPRDKGVGAQVLAGSINGEGMVEIRVSAAANASLLARIIHSVRDAQSSRAPTQRFIDRFSRIYTPLVVLSALAAALLLPLTGLMPWRMAVYQALVMLVIACPCAMVIATPVTLVSALASAARKGILIKGGEALETASRVRTVAFDKTGTLTTGVIDVVSIHPFSAASEAEVLAQAAALDAHSTHPLARALVKAAQLRKLAMPAAHEIREQAGRGVEGRIGVHPMRLGGRRQVERLGSVPPEVTDCIDALERQGFATLLLQCDNRVQGVIALADRLRPTARHTVALLERHGIRTVMLSGDNERAVAQMARSCGLTEAYGALLPLDKLERIEALRLHPGAVAMVGDGINDAPALARADLGIAMGTASDTALETATVVLMDDKLEKLPEMLAHARRTMRVLRFNLAAALLIKLAFFALALAGLASLWMAVVADVGASLLVVFNGLRLARVK